MCVYIYMLDMCVKMYRLQQKKDPTGNRNYSDNII